MEIKKKIIGPRENESHMSMLRTCRLAVFIRVCFQGKQELIKCRNCNLNAM